ncbi:L,D-transpeptidase [Metabacillus fastidiosus]|uniref:L,D-transpeptidase n=1 Tax=Metabacillus fastidiosus TaxID=1458 RepID=UPI002E1FFF4B|nr:L,D-transpeptidase [Metabacillus fastidiosus]
MKIMFAIFFFIMSPFWPLGHNPAVGNPYIIINKQINELAFIDDGEILKTYKIATGKTAQLTPEGEFNITIKAVNPYYRKKNIPGGSPENPLGTRWIGFDAENTEGRIFGIHGTNNESSIGGYVTQGCVRMFNEEVEELFEHIPVGTKVLILKSNESFQAIAKQKGAIE